MSTKNYWLDVRFIKLSLVKVTYWREQISIHAFHNYCLICAKSDKGSEHNAAKNRLIPSKSAQGRPHHFFSGVNGTTTLTRVPTFFSTSTPHPCHSTTIPHLAEAGYIL